jgi:hypothetical protein
VGELPESATAKTVLLQYGYNRESRTFTLDVTDVQAAAQFGGMAR